MLSHKLRRTFNMNENEQYIIEAATDCYEKNNVDKAIALGLTQRWWMVG